MLEIVQSDMLGGNIVSLQRRCFIIRDYNIHSLQFLSSHLTCDRVQIR